MRAKKRFGQNFLKDESIKNKIIQSMSHSKNNALVEIGPGLGDLTSKLLLIKPMIAYEVDDDLSTLLKRRFNKEIRSGQLTLKEIDVIRAWEEEGSLYGDDYDIVANLPYYIATSIVLRGLRDTNCKNMTLMVQKEVALKFAAAPMQKEFSSLSILAGLIAKVEILFDVPPSAFEPTPKVVSSVMKICKTREYQDLFSTKIEHKEFEKFLKQAFSAPRKTLIKNLSPLASKAELNKIFTLFNTPSTARPHQVDMTIYHHLFTKIIKEKVDEQRKNGAGGQ